MKGPPPFSRHGRSVYHELERIAFFPTEVEAESIVATLNSVYELAYKTGARDAIKAATQEIQKVLPND